MSPSSGTRRRGSVAALLSLTLIVAPAAGLAAPVPAPGTIAVSGAGFTRVLGPDALGPLPVGSLAVTLHGASHDCSGPTLWDVLGRAGVIGTDPKARARVAIRVYGRDGYQAVLALGEIDPAFEGKPVRLATRCDGAALASPRLLVPGDRHPGRDVRDVDRIDLR